MLNIRQISWRTAIKNVYVFGILAGVVIIFTIISAKFISPPSLAFLIQKVAPLLICSVAVTLLMMSGHLDLSVGSILAFSGVIMALLSRGGIPAWRAVIICVILGAVLGSANGFLTVKLRITPVIGTLVTMNILLGAAKILCGDSIPYVKGVQRDFSIIGRGKIEGWPISIFFIIAAIIIFLILQRKSVFGKYAIAIGGNRDAASLAGINVNKIVWLLYIFSGTAAAMAGCLTASNMNVADATSGQGFELDVITAILIGGTSWSGGEGSVVRTIAGAFLVAVLSIGLNMANVPSFYQYVVKGGVLIAAVYLDKIVREKISV
ncbi:MAG: ABC transporter permease [Treponema sp.]|jgi:ribose/xylose/arabinose/galactoside ABC-type transport system permease subunit|nr:ABC transporter permease [Treponema sp.]